VQDFFGREAFLTVSGQLNVEAYCLALSKVYTFGPTFRAENSNTSRHLAEFWMIEPEIAFANLLDNATLAEGLLKFTFETLLEQSQEDLAFFDERIEKGLVAKLQGIVSSEFVRMDYGEAIAVLERAKERFEFPVSWGMDLQSEHERYLTEKHVKKPVIVMNYPPPHAGKQHSGIALLPRRLMESPCSHVARRTYGRTSPLYPPPRGTHSGALSSCSK
jgi:asparaginyl-tRNA synthetase